MSLLRAPGAPRYRLRSKASIRDTVADLATVTTDSLPLTELLHPSRATEGLAWQCRHCLWVPSQRHEGRRRGTYVREELRQHLRQAHGRSINGPLMEEATRMARPASSTVSEKRRDEAVRRFQERIASFGDNPVCAGMCIPALDAPTSVRAVDGSMKTMYGCRRCPRVDRLQGFTWQKCLRCPVPVTNAAIVQLWHGEKELARRRGLVAESTKRWWEKQHGANWQQAKREYAAAAARKGRRAKAKQRAANPTRRRFTLEERKQRLSQQRRDQRLARTPEQIERDRRRSADRWAKLKVQPRTEAQREHDKVLRQARVDRRTPEQQSAIRDRDREAERKRNARPEVQERRRKLERERDRKRPRRRPSAAASKVAAVAAAQ